MPPKKEVPFIIQQAGKAVEEDIRPTLHLLGKIFFNAWPEKPAPRPTARSSKPLRLPPYQQIIVVQKSGHKAAGNSPYVHPDETILDAEIIEDSEISHRASGASPSEAGSTRIENSWSCPTCGGNGKLGRPGHEVPCPSCTIRSK